jgi:alginate O-acetyltransferase complex protein AlgI
MVFSSITFILYFLPAFLVLYYVTPSKYRNITLLLGSIFFYAWGAPKFIFVIIGTTIIDYVVINIMHLEKRGNVQKGLLALSVSINLALLFYFKYANFFVDNLNVFLGTFSENQMRLGTVLLPIGISFYTFESITYSVDIYRGIHKPLKRFTDYLLYILLFPKLIAGPIVRYQEIAGQIKDRVGKETIDNVLIGLYRFSIGLGKKALIANELGLRADRLMGADALNLSSPDAWVGALAYTFQIYFDFSGYSDMAIGICKMVGFDIPENFESPYTSKSITEFWRRWHISLGAWMKNYLYIPLGGNKNPNKWLNYRNLWVVFFISGLWHGASWTFVIWGLYHGFFIVLERSLKSSFFIKIPSIIKLLYTFFIVTLGWVFFRIENIEKAKSYFSYMFDFSNLSLGDYDTSFWVCFGFAVVFSLMVNIPGGRLLKEYIYRSEHTLKSHLVMTMLCGILLVLSVLSISANGFNPFIYFRF